MFCSYFYLLERQFDKYFHTIIIIFLEQIFSKTNRIEVCPSAASLTNLHTLFNSIFELWDFIETWDFRKDIKDIGDNNNKGDNNDNDKYNV